MASTNARAIVEDALSPSMTREIWSGSYDKALPITMMGFDLSAALPAVFYMFRYGQRRGRGEFLNTFAPEKGTQAQRRRAATIERIADKLAERDEFTGFEGEVEKAILSDLLLCFCLENVKYAPGRQAQVQRVAPVHYLAHWVDLPDSVAHLRYVPESIVAMLTDDETGEYIQHSRDGDRTWFPVGRGFEKNVLLRAFNQGVTLRGELSSRTADIFEEEHSVGLDQLLMIRLAQQLGAAPDKQRGSKGDDRISNQRPIAEEAARAFSEDIRRFVRAYARVIPRQVFVELLESCMAVGMTTILTSTIEILLTWTETGAIHHRSQQEPTQLFIDCSNGVDRQLRSFAEQSMDDFMRSVERLPVILMTLRMLDHSARNNPKIRKLAIPTRPFATEWLNLLGDLLHDRHPEAQRISYQMEYQGEQLAEQLADEYPDTVQLLRNPDQPNAVWRLAEAVTSLLGSNARRGDMIKMIDSTLLLERPNGLAAKRKSSRMVAGTRRSRDMRSLIITDAALDYLVHLHLLRNGHKPGNRTLSFRAFMDTLQDRYGFCVDVAPEGMTISNDLLQTNRAMLERRLRDLGLLVGVNDAEAMKRLRPRFAPATENEDGMD